jgi:ABC-type transporter Mla MlaB component
MKLEAKNCMLRIAIRSTQDQDTWILEGRLAGQVVNELTASWRQRQERGSRKSVVNLVDVTSVDERGEQALMAIMMDGAEFVVRGVYTKGLLESLSERCKREA